jgi:hypothetical protein
MKFSAVGLSYLVGLSMCLACRVDREGQAHEPVDDASQSPSTSTDAGSGPSGHDGGALETDDAGSEPGQPGDGGTRPDGGTNEPPSDPRDAVLGHFAVKRTFARVEELRSPGFGDDLAQLTSDFTRVEIVKDGKDYLLREQACRRLVTSRGLLLNDIEVAIDDAVPQSLPETESLLSVELAGDTLRFAKPLTSAPLGFVAQFESDPLPAALDDARVRDAEGDGQPAVTVHVRVGLRLEGDEYVVEWNRSAYTVESDEAGNFAGQNRDESELTILGTSPGDEALASPRVVRDANDTAQNRVTLVRLAEPLDCPDMLSRLGQLFPD